MEALKRAAELDPGARGNAEALEKSDETTKRRKDEGPGGGELSEVERLLAASGGWFVLQYTAGQDDHLVLDRKEGARAEEERLAKAMERLLPAWDAVMEDEEADMGARAWAVQVHRKTAVTLYNLACLACKAGELDAAREWLEKAFALDEGLRENAAEDEDLAELGLGEEGETAGTEGE